MIFGPNPSALVRGKSRENSAIGLGLDWKTIQLEPYPNGLLAEIGSKSPAGRKIFRLIGKIFSPTLFLLSIARIYKSDLIFVIKAPPLWLSRILKFMPGKSIIDFDDPLWLESMYGPKWFRKTLECYDGFSCDNDFVLNQVLDMDIKNSSFRGVMIVGELISSSQTQILDSVKELKTHSKINLVWVGSYSTFMYVRQISNELQEVMKRIPEAHLMLLGPTPAQLSELRIPADRVTCISRYDEELMVKVLSNSDIGLFPLDKNPLSYLRGTHKVNIYNRFGIPTVASNVPGLERALKNNFNGFICHTGDDWNTALLRLTSDSGLLDEFKLNAMKQHEIYQEELRLAVPNLINFVQNLG